MLFIVEAQFCVAQNVTEKNADQLFYNGKSWEAIQNYHSLLTTANDRLAKARLFNKIADKIYTIEAWNTPKTLTEYNITTGVSSVISNPAFQLGETSIVGLGGNLFVFGGIIAVPGTPNYNYFAYDFLNNTWSVANDLIPTAMMNGIASYNDTIYIPNGNLSKKYYCGSEVVTGINNAITPNAIIAYPNPTTGMLTINGIEVENIKILVLVIRQYVNQC